MRFRFRTLLLAGAAAFAMSAAAQAQTFVNGSPSPIQGTYKVIWNDSNISSGNPLPVAVVSGGGGGSGGTSGPYYVGQYNSTLPTFSSAQVGYVSLDINGRMLISPSSFPATQAVSGTVTANQGTSPWTVSGSVQNTAAGLGAVTTAAPSYTNGNTSALSLTTAGALRTDASSTTQPVSAANLPLPAGAATAANQSSEISALGTTGDAAYAGSGTASIIAGLKGVYFATLAPLAAGTNTIGSINNISGTVSLPTGAATAANQSSEIAALGGTGDTAYAGSGTASLVAALKGVYNLLDQVPAAVDKSYGPATTASNAVAANAKRSAIYVYNQNTFSVTINFNTTATASSGQAGNIVIPAGGDWRNPPGMVPKGAMSIIAGTSGGVVTIQEGTLP